jgi:hypothetical protein
MASGYTPVRRCANFALSPATDVLSFKAIQVQRERVPDSQALECVAACAVS